LLGHDAPAQRRKVFETFWVPVHPATFRGDVLHGWKWYIHRGMHGNTFTNSSSYIVLHLHICVSACSYISKRDKTAAPTTSGEVDLAPENPPLALRAPRSHFPCKHDGVMNIPPLPPGTILLVEVGSTAHGTGLPGGEDQDETAIVVESPTQVLGLDPSGPATIMQRTQAEGVKSGPGDIDRTLHPLRRFLYLAASGNPSVLMSL
jgi:RNA repair pathway DNA polymerase beta family